MLTIRRSQVLPRAQSWVGIGLVYDQANTHDGYRTDCSGYVSMCWDLGYSDDTTGFVPNGEAAWIPKADLKPGDAILNDAAGNAGHVVLFGAWANEAQSSYLGYEFTPAGVLCHTIPYPYFAGHGTFRPVACLTVASDPPTPQEKDMPSGIEITTGSNAISFPVGSCSNVSFFCDNTLFGKPKAQLRVVIWAVGSPPVVRTIQVGNDNSAQTALVFPNPGLTHSVTTTRVDAETFPIGVEVS